MTIQINDEQKVVPEGTTVNDVVSSILQLNSAGMAIAINDSIVPRHLWASSQLQTNDRMLVIKAASGG
jgi:sulfur carrier protein